MPHLQSTQENDGVVEEWMFEWCDMNWGELLQPAPLSIALLSSLLVIASSTTDFSLISEGNPPKLTYVKHPTSFKACLLQMTNSGHNAFKTASREMSCVNTASSQLPDAIQKATAIIKRQSHDEIRFVLPNQLDMILQLNEKCKNASLACEEAFSTTSKLAQEILETVTSKKGNAEQTVELNETRLSSLQTRVEYEEKTMQEAKEMADMMAKSFVDAEREFQSTVENSQSGFGWALNKVWKCLFGAGETKQSSEVLLDPGVRLAQQVLDLVSDLDRLIYGAPGGKPDWGTIRGSKEKGVGSYLETTLEGITGSLDKTKPISALLQPIVDKAIQITKEVNGMAKAAGVNDDHILDKYKPVIKTMIESLQEIVGKCKPILQQIQASETGRSSSRPTAKSANSKVDQARSRLEDARESYVKASSRLIKDQCEITETIAAMTKLSLDSTTLKEILPVLKKSFAAFKKLAAQFSKMTELFSGIAVLINERVAPQVTSCVKDMRSSAKMAAAGVALSELDATFNSMLENMKDPLKASMLAERISGTYLRVSREYIMPAHRELGDMLEFEEDEGEGKEHFTQKLKQVQGAIQEKSKLASEQIRELVAEDQKKYLEVINQRLEKVQAAVSQGTAANDTNDVPAPPYAP